MSESQEPPRAAPPAYIPPPPSEAWRKRVRVIFAALALAAFAGMWVVTDGLALGWRIVLCALIAAPFLAPMDLLRDKSKAPPGFRPRKWEDEED